MTHASRGHELSSFASFYKSLTYKNVAGNRYTFFSHTLQSSNDLFVCKGPIHTIAQVECYFLRFEIAVYSDIETLPSGLTLIAIVLQIRILLHSEVTLITCNNRPNVVSSPGSSFTPRLHAAQLSLLH